MVGKQPRKIQMAKPEPYFKGDAASSDLYLAWQLRAARAAANISADTLSQLAGVHVNTIRRAEKEGMEKMSGANQNAIYQALKKLGIVLGVDGRRWRTVSYQPPEAALDTPPAPAVKPRARKPKAP